MNWINIYPDNGRTEKEKKRERARKKINKFGGPIDGTLLGEGMWAQKERMVHFECQLESTGLEKWSFNVRPNLKDRGFKICGGGAHREWI